MHHTISFVFIIKNPNIFKILIINMKIFCNILFFPILIILSFKICRIFFKLSKFFNINLYVFIEIIAIMAIRTMTAVIINRYLINGLYMDIM